MSADVDVDAMTNPQALFLPSGTTPTVSVRDLNRGDRVFLAVTDDDNGSYEGLSACLVGFPTGLVHAHEEDD